MAIRMTLPELCGQLVVAGFSGTELPDDLRRELETGRSGGVILFKRNLTTLEQARALNESVLGACPLELPPFIAVDQEGGRVGRLPPPFLKLPPMRTLGSLGDAGLTERVGFVLGEELAALGFNLDFAPVLDVDSNPQNPVIGDRAFASDPTSVSLHGNALIRGLTSAGILACGKHFPGHGDTEKDSHLDLPLVAHDEARLRRVELVPFKSACALGVATLMSAHVVYEGLDPGTPATLSHRICTEILRGELGFGGVLFSDDLEMKALADRMSPAESAVGAIKAGCDVLLVCSSSAMRVEVVNALVHEAQRDPRFCERCVEAVERALAARRRCPPSPVPQAVAESFVGAARARKLEAEIAARTGA